MAWADRSSNMAVSFTDLQTAGFTLNGGESHVTSDNAVTKLDALTKYNLDPAYMDGYSNNWLVPKYMFVAEGSPPPPAEVACGVEYTSNPSILVYTQEVNVGTTSGLIIIDYALGSLTNGAIIEVQYEGGYWFNIASIAAGPSTASSSAIYYFNYNTSDTITVRTTKYT